MEVPMRTCFSVVGLMLTIVGAAPLPLRAEPPPIAWLQGPAVATLGAEVAELRVGEGFAFANAEDARRAPHSAVADAGRPGGTRDPGL
jgi:hypothetical protein